MGIIFNIDKNKYNSFLREFEADGVSSEDDDDTEYSMDGDDNGDDNTNTDTEVSPQDNDDDTQEENDAQEDDDYSMDGQEQSPDDEEENEDTSEDDDYTLDSGEDEGENEDTGENEGEGNPEDDDYSMDDDGSADGGDEGSGEDGGEGNPDDDDYSMDDDDSSDGESGDDADKPVDRLKELEGELFENLSPEQQQIKIDELKRCFQELYERCDGIIDMINNSNAPDENASKVLEYVNNNMSNLKQYIYDYFTYTFSTKSYPENDAQCQKYIAILNSYNGILEELLKNKEKDSK